jgi:hypothetical protein
MKNRVSSIGIAIITLASLGHAADLDRSMPASQCTEITATGAGLSIAYSFDGAAVNTNSQSRTFVCPFTRVDVDFDDVTDDGSFNDSATWSMWVNDRSTAANVNCAMRECNSDGTGCDSAQPDGSLSTGVQLLTQLGGDGGVAEGFAFLVCSMPGAPSASTRSSLIGYSVSHSN